MTPSAMMFGYHGGVKVPDRSEADLGPALNLVGDDAHRHQARILAQNSQLIPNVTSQFRLICGDGKCSVGGGAWEKNQHG